MSIGCAACGVSTSSSEDMEAHIRKAHDMWLCVHCPKQFPTVEMYVAHLEAEVSGASVGVTVTHHYGAGSIVPGPQKSDAQVMADASPELREAYDKLAAFVTSARGKP